ncbi:MAG: sigma-54-dependent Fis family transcriptional regulator [Acidobacteria bacterium]|nr:MAG: sigma-54-dependent Fis family transcriptional regulator [Acidobacteriota bacterium]
MACDVLCPHQLGHHMNVSAERKKKPTAPELANALPPDEILFGRSGAMKEVRKRATKIARTNIPVLLCGPKGSGKEVLARWIHAHSPVANGQFVKINCAAIPGTLLESELFGFEKGAFTGAHSTKPGRVELAHNGTLFLDGIADLDLASQSKLLQFLQDGRFSRIGDELERSVDTRLMCATDKDLEEEIAEGKFRADLYYRINVVRLKLPTLRDRREDIPAMAEYFLARCQEQFKAQAEPLTMETLHYMQCMDWPGNIRELSNGIARHVLIGPEATILEDSSLPVTPALPHVPANGVVPLKRLCKEAIRASEKNIILAALRANRWNRRKAAQELKISYRLLIYKIRDAGLMTKGKNSFGSPRG